MDTNHTNTNANVNTNATANLFPQLTQPKVTKTDFFFLEKTTDPYKKLWCKASKFFQKNLLNEKILLKADLCKVGKKLHMMSTRLYCFTDEYIFYKKNEHSKIKGVMNYNAVVCNFLDVDKKKEKDHTKKNKFLDYYSIQFTKNKYTRELMTKDSKIYLDICLFIRFKCILTTFHEEFAVIKNIGKGSFAKVFLCRKISDNNYFAVKCFKKDFIIGQQKGKESLINEIAIMRKYNHPNLIKIYEVYETENSIYMVLDLLEGGELFARLASKVYYDEDKISKLIKNLLSALNHLHKMKIMHRDLKPENILLKSKENDTDLVIADFGLSTEILSLDKILFKRCGTPGFVAPEVLNFDEKKFPFYNEKCDIFSVGVIFYILLTGKKPFEGKDCKTILRNNKKCWINYTLEEFNKVSPSAIELLKKMLSESADKRPSAEEALNHDFLRKPTNNKIQDIGMIENFINFQNEHQKAMQNKGSEGNLGSLKLLYTGSNKFDYKATGMNGKTDTIETLGSNISIKIRKDDSPQIIADKRPSRFSPTIKNPKHNSNFSNMMFPSNENVNIEDRSAIPSEKKIVKSTRKSEFNNNEFYKKVLINNALPNNRRGTAEETKEIELKVMDK